MIIIKTAAEFKRIRCAIQIPIKLVCENKAIGSIITK
jgi:hypothetical protein